ncbi:MAG: hypothetical protein ABI597_09065, partial [Gammaproteobacteria bacterium]
QPDIILHINPEHSRSPLDAATLKGHHAIVKQLNTALIKQKVKQLELIQSTQPKDKKAPESKTLLPDSKEQIFETDKNAQRISDKAKKKQAKKARQAQSQDNKIENTKLVLSKIKNNITKLVESISTFLNDMTDRNFSNNEEKVVEFKATKTQFNTEKTTLKDQYENHIPEADETNEEAYLTKLLDKLNELKTKIISYQGKLYDFVKELEETKRKQRNPDIKKSGTAKKIQTERIADHLRQRQEEREKTKREAEEQKKELKRVSQIRRDQVQKAAAQVKQAVTVVEESKNTEVDTSTATPRKLSGTRRASQITIEVKETRSNKQNLSLRQRIGIMIEHLINMHGILSYYVANEKPADKNYDNTLLSALIYNFIRYAEATKRIIKSVDDPSGKLNSQILDNFRNMLMHNDIFQINPEVVIETAKQFCEHIPTLLRQLRKHNLTESPLSTAQLEQLNLVFGVQEDQQSFAFFQLESTPLFRLLEACHVDDYADGVLEYTLIKIIADRIIPLVKNIQQDRNKVPQGNQTESKVEIENKLSDFQLHALKMLFTFCGELVLQHECKKRIKAIKKSRLNYENFDNIIKIYEFISYCNKNIRNKVGHRFPDCDSEAIAEAYKRMNKIDITPAQLTKKTRIPILVPRSTAVLSENVWGDELPTPTTTQINDEVKDDGRQTLSVKPLDKEPSAEEFIATMFGGVVEPTAIAEPRVPESAAPEIIIPTILQQPVLTNTNSSIQERSADSVVGINQEIKQSSELLPAFNDLMAITQVSPAVPERLATDFLVVPENPLRYLVTIGVNPVKRYYSSAHDELLNLQLKLDTNTRDYCSRILFVPNPEKRLVYEIRMGKDIYTYMNTEPDIGGEQFVEKIAQDLLSKLRKTEKYFPYFLKTVNHGADYLILKQLLCKDGIDRFDVSYTYNPHGTLTGERSTIKCTLMIYGQVLGEAIVVNQDNDSRHKAKAAAAKNAITIIQSCINRVTFEDYTKNYRRLFDSCHPSLMHLNKQNDITGEQKTSLPIPHRDTELNSNSASRGAQFFTRPQSQRQLWQPSRPRHPSVNLAANPSLSLMPATAQHSALTPAQASALSIYAASQSVAPSIQIIEQAITLNPVYVQVGALQDSNGTSLLFFQPLQVTYVQPTYSQLSQTLPSSSLVLSNMRHGSS